MWFFDAALRRTSLARPRFCLQRATRTFSSRDVTVNSRYVTFPSTSFTRSKHSRIRPGAAPQDLQGLLLKEAVYTAFSRCPSELAPSINFNQWLETTLIPEASSQDPKYVSFPFRSPHFSLPAYAPSLAQTTATVS